MMEGMRIMSYKRRVIATFTMAGMHCWPNAPLGAAHLRLMHRHLFHVRVEKDVYHNNRDIEFQILQRNCQEWLREQFPDYVSGDADLGTISCEDLAQMLIEQFELSVCEVSEDGENGARLEAVVCE